MEQHTTLKQNDTLNKLAIQIKKVKATTTQNIREENIKRRLKKLKVTTQ